MKVKSEQTATRIERALTGLHIADLSVQVIGDCVYLRGVASCYDKKRHAGEVAAAAAPGSCIENEIRVAQMAFAGGDELSHEVAEAIAARAGAEALRRLSIEARPGAVVISGYARDVRQRSQIEQAAWEASRAARVECHIATDAAPLVDAEIAEALNRYIERAMNVPPGTVSVRYASGVASLSGYVSSASQSQAIEDLVRWHDEVSDVVNGLRVTAPRAATGSAGKAL